MADFLAPNPNSFLNRATRGPSIAPEPTGLSGSTALNPLPGLNQPGRHPPVHTPEIAFPASRASWENRHRMPEVAPAPAQQRTSQLPPPPDDPNERGYLESLAGSFMYSLMESNPEMLVGTLRALGHEYETDTLLHVADRIEGWQQAGQTGTPPSIQSFSDIEDVDDAFRGVMEAVGQIAGSWAPVLAGGFAGFKAGTALGAGAGSLVAPGPGTAIGAALGGPIGGAAGAYTVSTSLVMGEAYNQIRDELVAIGVSEDEAEKRAGTGAVRLAPILGALDAIPVVGAAKAVGNRAIGQIKGRLFTDMAKALARGGALGAASEGFTEGAQNALIEAYAAAETGRSDDYDRAMRTLFAATVGAVGGGALRGAGEAAAVPIQRRRQRIEEERTQREADRAAPPPEPPTADTPVEDRMEQARDRVRQEQEARTRATPSVATDDLVAPFDPGAEPGTPGGPPTQEDLESAPNTSDILVGRTLEAAPLLGFPFAPQDRVRIYDAEGNPSDVEIQQIRIIGYQEGEIGEAPEGTYEVLTRDPETGRTRWHMPEAFESAEIIERAADREANAEEREKAAQQEAQKAQQEQQRAREKAQQEEQRRLEQEAKEAQRQAEQAEKEAIRQVEREEDIQRRETERQEKEATRQREREEQEAIRQREREEDLARKETERQEKEATRQREREEDIQRREAEQRAKEEQRQRERAEDQARKDAERREKEAQQQRDAAAAEEERRAQEASQDALATEKARTVFNELTSILGEEEASAYVESIQEGRRPTEILPFMQERLKQEKARVAREDAAKQEAEETGKPVQAPVEAEMPDISEPQPEPEQPAAEPERGEPLVLEGQTQEQVDAENAIDRELRAADLDEEEPYRLAWLAQQHPEAYARARAEAEEQWRTANTADDTTARDAAERRLELFEYLDRDDRIADYAQDYAEQEADRAEIERLKTEGALPGEPAAPPQAEPETPAEPQTAEVVALRPTAAAAETDVDTVGAGAPPGNTDAARAELADIADTISNIATAGNTIESLEQTIREGGEDAQRATRTLRNIQALGQRAEQLNRLLESAGEAPVEVDTVPERGLPEGTWTPPNLTRKTKKARAREAVEQAVAAHDGNAQRTRSRMLRGEYELSEDLEPYFMRFLSDRVERDQKENIEAASARIQARTEKSKRPPSNVWSAVAKMHAQKPVQRTLKLMRENNMSVEDAARMAIEQRFAMFDVNPREYFRYVDEQTDLYAARMREAMEAEKEAAPAQEAKKPAQAKERPAGYEADLDALTRADEARAAEERTERQEEAKRPIDARIEQAAKERADAWAAFDDEMGGPGTLRANPVLTPKQVRALIVATSKEVAYWALRGYRAVSDMIAQIKAAEQGERRWGLMKPYFGAVYEDVRDTFSEEPWANEFTPEDEVDAAVEAAEVPDEAPAAAPGAPTVHETASPAKVSGQGRASVWGVGLPAAANAQAGDIAKITTRRGRSWYTVLGEKVKTRQNMAGDTIDVFTGSKDRYDTAEAAQAATTPPQEGADERQRPSVRPGPPAQPQPEGAAPAAGEGGAERVPGPPGEGGTGDQVVSPGERAGERLGSETPGERGGPGPDQRTPAERPGQPDTGRVQGDATGRPDLTEEDAAEVGVGENHVITPGSLDEARGAKTKARDNIAAIKLAKKLVTLGRNATAGEQATLAKYVGWGGIKGAFPDAQGNFAKGYEEIGAELRDLLTEEEYRTAERSIQYAHYTSEPVIRAMWRMAEALGFTAGGAVHEPGAGIGHFAGLMPGALREGTTYHGVEMDGISATIAQLLYPKFQVQRADYTRLTSPEGVFDLAIGNPPFADVTVGADPKYAKEKFLLHDYFFAKALDAVRPGGLLVFISSAGTMNKANKKARKYMAERADLVGAIRLPNTAFEKNAGTSVTTDIIVLRKKLERDAPDRGPPWTDTQAVTLPNKEGKPTTGEVNRYFVEHPEMVLGEEGFFDPLYKDRYGVRGRPGQNLEADLAAAVEKLVSDAVPPAQPKPAISGATPVQPREVDLDANETKDGSFYVKDGELYQYDAGTGVKIPARAKGVKGGMAQRSIEIVKALVGIRDALRQVMKANLEANDAAGDAARENLNALYDDFAQRFGPIGKAIVSERRPSIVAQEGARARAREEARAQGIPWREGTFDATLPRWKGKKLNEIAQARRAARERAEGKPFEEGSFDPASLPDIVSKRYPNLDPFGGDPEVYRLAAMEVEDKATGALVKGPVFTENIIAQAPEPKIANARDAMLHVLNARGHMDLDEVAAVYGQSREQTIAELGDLIYEDPILQSHRSADEYLSGDVKTKLAQAREAAQKNPAYERNVKALEAVIPEDLVPSQIDVNLGASYLDPEVYTDFARHLGAAKVNLLYNDQMDQWLVPEFTAKAEAQIQWATPAKPLKDIFVAALNNAPAPKVYDHMSDGSRVLNKAETAQVQIKYDEIRREFDRWIRADAERAEAMARAYNEKLRRYRDRTFDGSYFTTPGVAKGWSWRPFQLRVIARIIATGTTYMVHAVGAGKTSAMIGAAMEMRRLGLVKKPMFVVPNAMLRQFATEWMQQYPTANIAVADKQNFHTAKRKQFIANIALDNSLDAVIVTHSSFGMIPISNEFEEGLIQEQLEDFRAALEEMDRQGESHVVRSRMQKRIERMEQKLRERAAKLQDQTFTFEETGADMLFVDEAHMFRKMDTPTIMQVKGVAAEGAAKSTDLYYKIRYLDTIRPGRSAVFASGTPVVNTMGELYNLSKYLQRPALEARGVKSFDAWARVFGQAVEVFEARPDGSYRFEVRFAKFMNLPELRRIVAEVADVVRPAELDRYVVRPKLTGGERNMVLAEKLPAMDAFQALLTERIRAVANRTGRPQKGDDNILAIATDGRKAAIDMRLFDATADNDPKSKLNVMIKNVFETWRDTKDQPFYLPNEDSTGFAEEPLFRGPATQIVFMALQKTQGGFNGASWFFSELRRMGVPPEEMADIRNYKTNIAKKRLYNDVNEGKVRILFGSPDALGTGVNVQKRLIASHNLDALWYPGLDEQRNGRIVRQGNMNPEVTINDYATEGTYDATMWQMMATKAKFIESFWSSDDSVRSMEDLGEASYYEQAKAQASGDPRLERLAEMRRDIQQLEAEKISHERKRVGIRSGIVRAQGEQDAIRQYIPGIKQAIDFRQDTTGDNFRIEIKIPNQPQLRTTSREEAGEALIAAQDFARAAHKTGADAMTIGTLSPVGRFAGFNLKVASHTPRLVLNIGVESILFESGSPKGIVSALEAKVRGLDKRLEQAEENLAEAERLEATLNSDLEAAMAPFPKQEEYETLVREARDLEVALAQETIERERQAQEAADAAKAAAEEAQALPEGEARERAEAIWKYAMGEREAHGVKADSAVVGLVRSNLRSFGLGQRNLGPVVDALAMEYETRLTDAPEGDPETEWLKGVLDYAENELSETLTPEPKERRWRTGVAEKLTPDQLAAVKKEFQRIARAMFGHEVQIEGTDGTPTMLGNIIRIVFEHSDRIASLGHEGIHWLRSTGAFTTEEWAALERQAKKRWMKEFNVAENYPNLNEAAQVEEAIAEAFGRWLQARTQPGVQGLIARVFASLRRFLRNARRWLMGQKWFSAEDIFEDIASGTFSATAAQQSEQSLKDLRQAAKGLQGDAPGMVERAAETMDYVLNAFGRYHRKLPQTEEFADFHESLRLRNAATDAGTALVARYIRRVVEGLNARQYRLLAQKVLVDDLIWSRDEGLEVPFDVAPNDLEKLAKKVESELALEENQVIHERLRIRNEMKASLRDELIAQGVLDAESAKNPHYFRHQVLMYAVEKATAGGSGPIGKKRWERRRGGEALINADFVEPEAEWMHQAYIKIATNNLVLNQVKGSKYDITDRVRTLRRDHNKRNTQAALMAAERRAGGKMPQTFEEWKGYEVKSDELRAWRVLTQRMAFGFRRFEEGMQAVDRDTIPEHLRTTYDQVVKSAAGAVDTKTDDYFGLVGWALQQPDDYEAVSGARILMATMHRRTAFQQEFLGKKYIPVGLRQAHRMLLEAGESDLAGHRLWQPDPGYMLHVSKTVPQAVMEHLTRMQNFLEQDAEAKLKDVVSPEAMRTVMEQLQELAERSGPVPKPYIVLKEEVADTLDETTVLSEDAQYIGRLLRKTTSAFKVWILLNPLTFFRYHSLNLSGDVDIVIASMPDILTRKQWYRRMGEAMRILFDEEFKGKEHAVYAEAIKRGIVTSNWTTAELPDTVKETFLKEMGEASPGTQGNPIKRTWSNIKRVSNLRENILRLALYLELQERGRASIEKGQEPLATIGYGAARRELVRGLTGKDAEELLQRQIGLITRETLGDYQRLSPAGSRLRTGWVPFFAFQEINLRRYTNLFRNIWYATHEERSASMSKYEGLAWAGKVAGLIAKQKALASAALMARLGLYLGMLMAADDLIRNLTGCPASDDGGAVVKRGLTVFCSPKNNVHIQLRSQGSFTDVLGWAGFPDIQSTIYAAAVGMSTWGEAAAVAAESFLSKGFNSITPFVKAPIESVSGLTFYPRVTKPRPIRERWRHAMKMGKLEWLYDALTDEPQRLSGFQRYGVGALFDTRDTAETAYFEIRSLAYTWTEEILGRENVSVMRYGESSNLMHYYRIALRKGDKALAQKFRTALAEHIKERRRQGVNTNMAKLMATARANHHPLKPIKKAYRTRFLRELTPRDRERYERAMAYHRSIWSNQ